MTSLLHSYEGGCHCGALGFTFRTALPVTRWNVRACGCGFCRVHGAATTSDPSGWLAFHARERESLQRYRFGLMTADFLLCRRCGVYVGAQIDTATGAFGIVNTLALTAVPEGLPDAVVADYCREHTRERMARRATKWTPLEKLI